MEKRSRGYIYHKGKLYLNIKKYLAENKITLIENDDVKVEGNQIKGQIVCRGKAKGIARIIFELSDLPKVKKGDIIITPMTTPDMMLALNLASAIVTDEGGVTCHAAIISRELKKPCVIGTKIATKYIKDGDMVEVDADNGIVKIS